MDVSPVSVMIAISVLWSLRNFCSSMVLFLMLVAFHKVNFSDLLCVIIFQHFYYRNTLLVAFTLSKLFVQCFWIRKIILRNKSSSVDFIWSNCSVMSGFF